MPETLEQIDRRVYSSPKIDQGKLLKQYFINGMLETDIAEYFGVSKQAINQALKPYKELIKDPDKVKAYRENRSIIFDGLESQLVSLALDRGKHKKATLGNVLYGLDKVYNINRLEKGLSTQNVAVLDLTPGEREQLRQLEELEQAQDVVIEPSDPDSKLINTNNINEL